MDKESFEFYISWLLSEYSAESGNEVKDIKVKTKRIDTVFNRGESYFVEVTI